MKTVGMIGTGNMGSALAETICCAVGAENLYVSDAAWEKAEAFASKMGCHATDNASIAAGCDLVIFAVKPQGMEALLTSLAPVFAKRKTSVQCISIAVGISLSKLSAWLGADALPIFRVMPNTPALVGAGMLLYTVNAAVTEAMEAEFCEMLRYAGKLSALPEHQMDAAGALSGCGPAYAALIAEGLADGAVQCGIPRDKALLYAWQTLLGTAQLALETGMHPGALKDAVCSPGGTTICGVAAMEEHGVRNAMRAAVCAAYVRSLELGK